jgi:hypothetical protein
MMVWSRVKVTSPVPAAAMSKSVSHISSAPSSGSPSARKNSANWQCVISNSSASLSWRSISIVTSCSLWYEEKAKNFGIAPEQFAELIKAQIAAREKAAAEKLTQEKLSEQRAERHRKTEAQEFREKARAEDAAFKKSRTKAKVFADIVKLSADQHDGKIEELAKLIAEDVEALKAEFADYCAAEIADSISSDFEESWPRAGHHRGIARSARRSH